MLERTLLTPCLLVLVVNVQYNQIKHILYVYLFYIFYIFFISVWFQLKKRKRSSFVIILFGVNILDSNPCALLYVF